MNRPDFNFFDRRLFCKSQEQMTNIKEEIEKTCRSKLFHRRTLSDDPRLNSGLLLNLARNLQIE